MSVVTLDDIAAAVKARCAVSAFTTALPGGAWHDRGPDEPSGPYTVFTLEPEGEPEFDSGGEYLQGYVLRMVAYTVQGLNADRTPQQATDGSSASAAQLAMAAALNPNPTTWDALRDGKVNVCLPRPYSGKHADRLREGRDTFAAAGQWFMLIEGNRAP